MKLTFIGAGGVRTPLVIQSLIHFQERLPLERVCLMDIDEERLQYIRRAVDRIVKEGKYPARVESTTDREKDGNWLRTAAKRRG